MFHLIREVAGRRVSRGITTPLLVGIVLAGLAAAALGGGGYWYVSKVRPAKLVQGALTKLGEASSVEYAGTLDFTGKLPNPANLIPGAGLIGGAEATTDVPASAAPTTSEQVKVSFQGLSDLRAVEKRSGAFAFQLTLPARPGTTGGQQVATESRVVDNVVYARLTALPDVGFDVSAFKDQWVKLDFASVLSDLGLSQATTTLEADALVARPTPTERSELKAAFEQAGLFTLTRNYGAEQVNGEPVYHYAFMVKKEALAPFILQVARILRFDQQFAKQLVEVEQNVATIEAPQGEVWIRKQTGTFAKITLEVKPVPTGAAAAGLEKFFAEVSFKNFNQPVQVAAPESAKTIQEMLNTMFESLSGIMPVPGTMDAGEPDSDTDNLSDAFEKSIGTNPNKADTDADGVTDGDESMLWGTNPLKADTDGDTHPDGQEIKNGFDPNGPGKLPKLSGSGLLPLSR